PTSSSSPCSSALPGRTRSSTLPSPGPSSTRRGLRRPQKPGGNGTRPGTRSAGIRSRREASRRRRRGYLERGRGRSSRGNSMSANVRNLCLFVGCTILVLATVVRHLMNEFELSMYNLYNTPQSRSVADAKRRGTFVAEFKLEPAKLVAGGKAFEFDEV